VTAAAGAARPRLAGVLLDADDTLYDTRAAMHSAGAVAARALWPDAHPDRVARAGVRFRDDPEGHFPAFVRGEVDFQRMRRSRVAALAEWLGQPVTDRLWSTFEAHYEPAFLAAMTAFDDVRPMLDGLRAAGLAVGVLTNSSQEYTDRKMRASGLDGAFDVVCSRDTLGFGKPDVRAFHEACRRLGTAPRSTLYVGDDLETDPLGAADAGLRAVWLVRDGEPDGLEGQRARARSIPVIHSLVEVVGLVQG
jgi:putative hydrolase of the HAD superfamily